MTPKIPLNPEKQHLRFLSGFLKGLSEIFSCPISDRTQILKVQQADSNVGNMKCEINQTGVI